jgi:hypothetical protein
MKKTLACLAQHSFMTRKEISSNKQYYSYDAINFAMLIA